MEENELEQTEVVDTTAENVSEESTETTESTTAEESNAENTEGEENSETEANEEAEAGAEGEENAEAEAVVAYKPNTKIKVGTYDPQTRQFSQKEMDIDARFHDLMKTPEDEKLIRELHEKAHGLDSVKARFTEEKNVSTQFKSHYSELQNIYKQATTGPETNILKMDKWLKTIDVPEAVMLKWAEQKVKLFQLSQENPEQYNAIQAKLDSENLAEDRLKQQTNIQHQYAEQAQQIKTIQLDSVLQTPDAIALAAQYTVQTGKSDFKEAVIQAGKLAWFTSQKDISPQEALQNVVSQFGLKPGQAAPAQNGAGGSLPSGAPKKAIAQKKTTGTIPNIQGKNSSPLRSKPKSVEDILKHRKEAHGF